MHQVLTLRHSVAHATPSLAECASGVAALYSVLVAHIGQDDGSVVTLAALRKSVQTIGWLNGDATATVSLAPVTVAKLALLELFEEFSDTVGRQIVHWWPTPALRPTLPMEAA